MIRALLLAGAIAATVGCLGPSLDDHGSDFDAARAMEESIIQAQEQAQAQARYESAAKQICGDNAAWMQIEHGVIQCYTHRGAKTITATIRSTP